jgi:hypothetical protein
MELIDLWQAFFVVLVFHILSGIIKLIATYKFLQRKIEYGLIKNATKVFIVIPLLREQKRFVKLFSNFENILADYPCIDVVFVTTEREYLEKKTEFLQEDTPKFVRSLVQKSINCKRYIHLHYPKYNAVVAYQLNFAVKEVINNYASGIDDLYFGFYNADSIINKEVFDYVLPRLDSQSVYQQSSLFCANFQSVGSKMNIFTACFGIYQSIWTLKHEIPRLFLGSNENYYISKITKKYYLNYCITHGLFVPAKVINSINGFPVTKQGGEDIAIGYIIRSLGYTIKPIPILENSDTPETLKSIWVQLATWFVALLGYFEFHKYVLKLTNVSKTKLAILSFQGIFDAMYWLLKGILLLGFLFISILINKLLTFIFLFGIDGFISVCMFLIVYNNQDKKIFPKFNMIQTISIFLCYPIIVIIRSFPAIQGLVWYIMIKLNFQFIRKKTE